MQRIIHRSMTAIFMCLFLVSAVVGQNSEVAREKAEQNYKSIRESVWYESNPQNETVGEALMNEPIKEDICEENYKAPMGLTVLMEQNQNVVGWIKIDDTVIDYPIVQNIEDNEYYLDHDIVGKESSSGSIYLDSLHQIGRQGLHALYGHNMKNGTMFKDISKYIDFEYMKSHQNIKIYTSDRLINLEPVYCYAGPADGSFRAKLESTDSLQDFLYAKTGVKIQASNIYVLITCSYGGNNERTYLITKEKG